MANPTKYKGIRAHNMLKIIHNRKTENSSLKFMHFSQTINIISNAAMTFWFSRKANLFRSKQDKNLNAITDAAVSNLLDFEIVIASTPMLRK